MIEITVVDKAVRGLLLCSSALVAACVYVPQTTLIYDYECKVVAKHMVLEGAQVAAIQHCENQGCVALIAAAGAVSAATFVVSGSIVLVGNIVYWVERKANCKAES